MKRLLKKLSFVVLLLAIVFVPALLISASGAISVKVSTYTSETISEFNPTITNVSRDLGYRQSITPPEGTTFAFFALNGYVSEKLASDYQFPVRTKTEIDAYYHPAGQFVVIFADSNNKVLDVKYVTSGQTVSVTAANTAAATLVKYGMTLNGESTRWKTSDNIGPEVAITSNRIFYAQYTKTNASTYNLTVTGGISNKETYAFNEIATVTANTPSGGNVFSHWEDAEGNVLSTKSVYKFTMYKTMAVTAIFAASPEYNVPVVNMSDAIVLRDNTVSYLGQFDLPAGYEFIESGFLFSRSSMILFRTSLGATIAQSNVHNSTTKEYLMTFSDTLFNSIRAYVTVKQTSNSEILTYYSENVYRNSEMIQESAIKSIGFESGEGFAASSTYNNATPALRGDEGSQWSFYYGTTSTNDAITSSQSAQMRWYTSAPANKGYVAMDFDLMDISKVEFKAFGNNGLNVRVDYLISEQGGWVTGDVISLTDTSADYVHSINQLGVKRIRFVLVTPSTLPTEISKVVIDSVVLYSKAKHEVVYNNEGSITTVIANYGSLVSSPSPKTGYNFNGWYTDESFTTLYGSSTPISQSLRLHAKWTIGEYTISFVSNGGSSVTSIVQNYNTSVTEPSEPTRDGFDFDGWYQNEGLTELYEFTTMPGNNITLYAKWIQTASQVKLLPPSNLSIHSSTEVLTWSSVSNASSYTIYVGDQTYTGITGTTFNLGSQSLTGNRNYEVKIRAIGDGVDFTNSDLSALAEYKRIRFTDLIISEYVEGSSSNKYIEIYNGTGAPVDLSNYKLRLFANGASTPTNDVALSGTLAHNSTIVYKNSGAALTLPVGVTAYDNAAVNYNGDDALGLWKISTSAYVDIFGRIGNDPGSAWTGDGGYTTENKTLVRKPTVYEGVTTSPSGTGQTAFTTLTTEWEMYANDTASNLGSHAVTITITVSIPN